MSKLILTGDSHKTGPHYLSIAESMYGAYGKSTNFKNFQGNPMPEWGNLPEAVQRAWEASAKEAHRIFESLGTLGENHD